MEWVLRKIYQKTWFNIDFNILPIFISNKDIANVDFYTCFYKEFYKRYKGYDELPKYWTQLKDEIVEHLSILSKDKKILSIGCGNGYVESKLLEQDAPSSIVAIEPGNISSKWINQKKISLFNGLFPQAIEGRYKASDFDLIYASGIDYVFNDKQYVDFLKSVTDFGVDEFLLTEIFVPSNRFLSIAKYFIESFFEILGLYDRGQFWGYMRSIDEHKDFLTKAGFNNFKVGSYEHGGRWIFAKK